MAARRLVTARAGLPDFENETVGHDGKGVNPRNKLEQETIRRIRELANLGFFGRGGVFFWIGSEVGVMLVTYSFFCGSIVSLYFSLGISVPHDIFGLLPGVRPFLVDALLILAALIVGFGISDAAVRFKAAMAALVRLRSSVEKLRAVLLANTNDPKLRIAVQVLISWSLVLLQKQISFFREDYSVPIGGMVPGEFCDCALFDPEVLWSFDKPHAEVIFASFLREAKLFDSEGQVGATYKDAIDSWTDIEEMLQVRAPGSKRMLGTLCVLLFLLTLPIACDDLFTVSLAPLAACVFLSILQLARELSDPWGTDRHDPPLGIVLQFLCMPVWGEEDKNFVSASLTWLDAGLTQNEWTWTADHPIPRTKERGASKGTQINFHEYRSLPMIAGYRSYASYVQAKAKEMDDAESEGRRLPVYLKWRMTAL